MIQLYVHIDDTDKLVAMEEWCSEVFKPGTWRVSYVDDSDYNLDVNFYFADEGDCMWFKIRWLS